MVSVSDTLISMTGVSDLAVEGVILEACRGTAIVMSNCARTKIAGCVLRNL